MPTPTSPVSTLAPESLGPKRRRLRAGFVIVGGTLGALAVLAVLAYVYRPRMVIPAGDFTQDFTSHQDDGLPVMLNPGFALAVDGPGTSSRALAVRIGARMVDVEVAATARNAWSDLAYYHRDPTALANVAYNSELVAGIADSLIDALRRIPSTTDAAQYYRHVWYDGDRGATINPYALILARQHVLAFRPEMIALGNWLEAARVAAMRGDRGFFTQLGCVQMAVSAPKLAGMSSDSRRALTDVQGLVVPEPPADSMVLVHALTHALVTLTR